MQSYLNKTNGRWEEVRGHNGGVATAGFVSHLLSNANTPAGALSNFDFQITPTDFVTHRQSDNGQNILSLSVDPLTADTLSVITQRKTADAPFRLECELGLSQRVKGAFTALEMVDLSDPQVDPLAPIAIASISQAGSTLTIILQEAFNGNLGDMFSIADLADNRLNYANCVVSSISVDRKTVTSTVSDEATLPALTVGPYSAGTFIPYWNLLGRSNGMGLRFSGVTPTSAVLVSRRAGGDIQESGTLTSSHLATIASTSSVYNSGGGGKVELRTTSRYRLITDPDCALFADLGTDSASGTWTTRARRTSVKPGWARKYTPRIRAVCPPSMSRPIAKIVAISKSGSGMATVTTEQPHGLTTASFIAIAGVADQTNFANSGSAHQVQSVINATQFTTTFGAVATATSYGGAVILANGQVTQPGQITQSIINVTAVGSTGILTLTGSGTWAGVNVGDYVNLFGVCNSAGVSLGLDGVYEVLHFATSTLVLRVVVDIFGQRISPVFGDIGTINAGGLVIHRTTLRIHDMTLAEESQTVVIIDGQGTSRADKALPVTPAATFSVQGGSSSGTTAVNPVTVGTRAVSSNPTAVTSGQQVFTLATLLGALVTRPYSIPEADWNYSAVITNNTDTAMQAAGGTGIRKYCTGIQVQNTHASVATTLIIKDGTSAKWTIYLPANMAVPVSVQFPTPIASAANTAINVACGTTGANVYVNAQGYTAP